MIQSEGEIRSSNLWHNIFYSFRETFIIKRVCMQQFPFTPSLHFFLEKLLRSAISLINFPATQKILIVCFLSSFIFCLFSLKSFSTTFTLLLWGHHTHKNVIIYAKAIMHIKRQQLSLWPLQNLIFRQVRKIHYFLPREKI